MLLGMMIPNTFLVFSNEYGRQGCISYDFIVDILKRTECYYGKLGYECRQPVGRSTWPSCTDKEPLSFLSMNEATLYNIWFTKGHIKNVPGNKI